MGERRTDLQPGQVGHRVGCLQRVERGYEIFLRSWGRAPSSASRMYHSTLLHSLQRLVEVEETLDVLALRDWPESRGASHFRQLLNSWHVRLPSRREDGVLAWDSLIGARNALLDQLEANITGADITALRYSENVPSFLLQ